MSDQNKRPPRPPLPTPNPSQQASTSADTTTTTTSTHPLSRRIAAKAKKFSPKIKKRFFNRTGRAFKQALILMHVSDTKAQDRNVSLSLWPVEVAAQAETAQETNMVIRPAVELLPENLIIDPRQSRAQNG
uniref:Uncharacterized protein n=1 Tax=Ditylenchus dipsaci TaxID=166011 RepID=A0A915CV27_9BILA